MTVRAKKLQVINGVIAMITINMMNLEHQFLSVPLPQPTDLTMGISPKYPPDILSFKI